MKRTMILLAFVFMGSGAYADPPRAGRIVDDTPSPPPAAPALAEPSPPAPAPPLDVKPESTPTPKGVVEVERLAPAQVAPSVPAPPAPGTVIQLNVSPGVPGTIVAVPQGPQPKVWVFKDGRRKLVGPWVVKQATLLNPTLPVGYEVPKEAQYNGQAIQGLPIDRVLKVEQSFPGCLTLPARDTEYELPLGLAADMGSNAVALSMPSLEDLPTPPVILPNGAQYPTIQAVPLPETTTQTINLDARLRALETKVNGISGQDGLIAKLNNATSAANTAATHAETATTNANTAAKRAEDATGPANDAAARAENALKVLQSVSIPVVYEYATGPDDCGFIRNWRRRAGSADRWVAY